MKTNFEITTQENFTGGYAIIDGVLHLANLDTRKNGYIWTAPLKKVAGGGRVQTRATEKLNKKQNVTHFINNCNGLVIDYFLKENNIAISN